MRRLSKSGSTANRPFLYAMFWVWLTCRRSKSFPESHHRISKAVFLWVILMIYGVGIYTRGRFSSRASGGGSRQGLHYQRWSNMLERCYSGRFPAYADCYVCEEWKEFQVFAEWFDENYIEGFCLDKDILKPGNKLYSPDSCGFVPTIINTMLGHASRKHTVYNLPTGVSFCTFTSRYIVVMSLNGKSRTVGRFDSPDVARQEYIRLKKIEVVRMANEWRGRITEQMYEALLVFPVDMEK